MLLEHYNKPQVRKYVANEVIKRVAHGIYYHKDFDIDMMRIKQAMNRTIVYSHETAAYLYNLTDRFPRKYSITVN